QRRWPARVVLQQPVKFTMKFFVTTGFHVFALQLLQGGHQSLWNIAAAVGTKTSRRRFCLHCRFHDFSAFRTAATKAFSFSGSLRPGPRSTPETTSTPHGSNFLMASPTF